MTIRYSYLLLGALLCLLIVSRASAQCLCAEKGLDYCTCKDPIRPAPKLIARLKAAKFPPIGDNCWCGKQLVEPAVLPKPKCKTPAKCDCKCDLPPPPAPYFEHMKPSRIVHHGVPADPISISLALRAGKTFAVPEGRLSYGPVSAPLNKFQKVYVSNIPEEKLHQLNCNVIELKKRIRKPEIIEEHEEEEEVEHAHVPPHLTYHELGYGPAKFANPQFVRATQQYEAPAPVATQPLTGCGYVPGKINLNAKLIYEPHSYPFIADCL